MILIWALYGADSLYRGIAIRIGKEYADDVCCEVYHLTIQIVFGQLTIGVIGRK